MKRLLLASLILLNGCVFNDMMTSVNSSLKSANNTLSGTGSGIEQSNNTKGETINNDVDCEKDSKKFKEWNTIGKNKIYSSNAKKHVKTLNSKQKEMNRIQYNLMRYCDDRYANDSFLSEGLNINKEYLDKIELEQAQNKINKTKGKK